jgi:copper chaperone CopZ
MATENEGNDMREKLVERLQDIPGVASVSLDIDEIDSGIKVKLDDDANEAEVLEAVRSLLAA